MIKLNAVQLRGVANALETLAMTYPDGSLREVNFFFSRDGVHSTMTPEERANDDIPATELHPIWNDEHKQYEIEVAAVNVMGGRNVSP